jgi:hypothetical protein
MKTLYTTIFSTLRTSALLYLLLSTSMFVQAQTEDPCVTGGYFLSTTSTDATCYGANNGTATVASSGCNCVFSGCLFLWQDGQQLHTATNLVAGVYSVTITHPNGCIMDTFVVVGQPDSYISDLVTQNPLCPSGADGSAQVIPTDIAGPLTYEWSSGDTTDIISGVSAGTYRVTVTNYIGCRIVREVVIEDPIAPQLDISVQKTCANTNSGTAEVTVTGGTPPFTYLWSDASGCPYQQAENLAAGDYTVWVTDANGCEHAATATVETFSDIAMEANVQNACLGADNGSVSISINGAATFPLNFYWNGTPLASSSGEVSVTDLAPGTYEFSMTDGNNCSQTQTITIGQDMAAATITGPTSAVCAGQPAQLSTTGGSTYVWSPATGLSDPNSATPTATIDQTTTYQVEITTDAGCISTASITLNVQPTPQLSINAWDNTICQGESTQLVAMVSGGASSFSWSPATGLSSTTTNAPYANPSQTTNYIVVVSNASGCTASAEVLITVEDCTGISGADQTSAVQIYPNPASNGQFTLILNQALANSDLKATVYSTNGQLLYNRHFPNTNNAAIALQLTDFPSGLYYLELQSENARVVEKLIIR